MRSSAGRTRQTASTHSSNLPAKVGNAFSDRTQNPSFPHLSKLQHFSVAAPNPWFSERRDRPILFEASPILRQEQRPASRLGGAHQDRRQPRTLSMLACIRGIRRDALSAFSVLPRSSPPRSRRRKAQGIRRARPFPNAPHLLFVRCYFP